jgi:hypothetical protein
MKALLLSPSFPKHSATTRTIVRTKPQFLNMYLGLCAAGEHFCEYRALARERITQQLGYDPLIKTTSPEREPTLVGA